MKRYYYLNAARQKCGPVDESQLSNYDVTPDTLVWAEGMADWTRAGDVVAPIYLAGNMVPPPVPGAVPPAAPAMYGAGQSAGRECPDTYLVWSILTTVLCCLPAGVAAIVYSTKVEPLWRDGRYEEAQKNSDNARRWCIISAIGAAVVWVIWLICVVLAAALD